ncbi:TPA: Tn3 family transposase, partial [Legionella pneumophila]
MTKKNRLQLLTEPEIEDFYARPNFNSGERELYFAMNPQEMIALRQYSATKTQIAFRLQLAYFKAKQKFFEFTFNEVHDDVAYLIAKYYKNAKAKLPSSITRQTLNQQKQDILNLFDFQDWSLKQNALVESHLCELLRYYPKGNDTFRQLLVYFENQKILLPSYRTLQDLFTRAFSRESERIGKLIQLIPQEQQEKLSNLIKREEGSTKFNVIRADQKSFKYNPIKEEVAKAVELLDLYAFAGDGQKMPTSESTIQSRYSKKYLGKAPGISVYTLIANFIAVNAKNIGLNEYEGHSLYDLINGNKTDINIDMVTGDNHSLNQLNFVILDSIDVEYVPSIKDIREAAQNLLSVKPVAEYKGMICPSGVVNASLIRSQKRGILRILLSLLLQENTQSTIVKKINSSARYSGLKKALFEYNKLLKSIHVLNLIDNVALRKAIRTARNRTEAYHQLQGLIRK